MSPKNKEYYAKNKDRMQANSKKYYAKNKELSKLPYSQRIQRIAVKYTPRPMHAGGKLL